MKKIVAGCAFLVLTAIASGIGAAWADNDSHRGKGEVKKFATLPAGARFPEGITANPANGDIFVATFDAPSPTNPNPNNKLLRFNRHGTLEASRAFGVTPLLGLEFDRANKKVYIAYVGDFSGFGSRIQRIAADFNGATLPEDVATIPPIGAPGQRTVDNPDGRPHFSSPIPAMTACSSSISRRSP